MLIRIMRFTWVALLVLFATLVPPSATAPAILDDTERSSGGAIVIAAAGTHTPIAFLPSVTAEAEVGRMMSETTRRDLAPEENADDGSRERSAATAALILLRVVDRAGLDFTAELNRFLTGSISSHTTACPPPAAD